jgi:hypothetical protein
MAHRDVISRLKRFSGWDGRVLDAFMQIPSINNFGYTPEGSVPEGTQAQDNFGTTANINNFGYTPEGSVPEGTQAQDNFGTNISLLDFSYIPSAPPPPSSLDLNDYGDAAIVWAPSDYSAGSVPNTASDPIANADATGTATLVDSTDLGSNSRPTLQIDASSAAAFSATGLSGLNLSTGFTIVCVINSTDTVSPMAFLGPQGGDQAGDGDIVQFHPSGGSSSQSRLNYIDYDTSQFLLRSAFKLSAPAGVPSVVVGHFAANSVRVWVNGAEGDASATDTIPNFTVQEFRWGRRFLSHTMSLGHAAVYRGLPNVSDLNTALLNHYGIS